VLTAARPLVLILEDLHWSDRATLEWLAYVVRRRDLARLLLLGTYRPVEVIVHAPALRAIVAEIRHTTRSMPSWCSTICQKPRLQRICSSAAERSPSPQACLSSCISVPAAIRYSSSPWWTSWYAKGSWRLRGTPEGAQGP
jgi:hypothetical protein